MNLLIKSGANVTRAISRGRFKSNMLVMLVGIALSIVFPSANLNPAPNFSIVLAALDPVIAAAGDIACDPLSSTFNGGSGGLSSCRQKYTSNLLVNTGLSAILPLGDDQYYCGSYDAFIKSYDLSWGRVKSITHPSLGNHEYITTSTKAPSTGCDSTNQNAAGYFKYFGSAAGAVGKGYYSYNIGTWHLIVLNSNCENVGGCGSGSPQYQWLSNDLASHSNYCTLAYWHIPLFSSGGRASVNSKPFWQLLYHYNADLILNGHDHIYERFAPQDPEGVKDLARGIREFIIGTGGSDHTGIPGSLAANSEVHNTDTFGVLRITLHPTSYDWKFIPEAGKTFTDSGTTNCHTDTTPPSAPANLTAKAVIWNQVNLSWTASTDDIGVKGYQIFRNGTQIKSTTNTSYSDTTTQPQTTYSYYVKAVDAAGNKSNTSNTVSVTTPVSPSPTPTSTPQSSTIFSDGFESGDLSKWTNASGLMIQSQEVASGSYAARGTSAAGAATYARKTLNTPQDDLYYKLRLKVISQGANPVSLMKFRTAANSSILSVGINSIGQLNYRNDITGLTATSSTVIGTGNWQTLEVHAHIADTSSQMEVWYNGTRLDDLSRTDSLGTNPVGILQLGENAPGLTYDIAFDNITISLAYVSSTNSSSTSALAATNIESSTPTPTVNVIPVSYGKTHK